MMSVVTQSPEKRAGLLTDPVIARCVELAQANANVQLLWLYGSRAKGTAQADSDYDFAVAFTSFPDSPWDKRLQPVLLAQQWADELGVADDKISVIDITHVPVALGLNVIRDGLELVVKDGLRLAREENRITGLWEEECLRRERNNG